MDNNCKSKATQLDFETRENWDKYIQEVILQLIIGPYDGNLRHAQHLNHNFSRSALISFESRAGNRNVAALSGDLLAQT